MLGRWCGIFFISLFLCACGSATERKASYVEMAKALIQDQNLPKARVALRNALKIDPQDPQVLFLLSQVSEKAANWTNTFNQHEWGVELDSTHPKGKLQTISTHTETLWNFFELKLAQQQWAQANDVIIRLKTTGASTDQVDLATGLLAANRQQWDQAIQALSRAQHANLNALPPLAALVKVHLKRKQPEQALSYLEEILSQFPDHPFASGLLGAVLWNLKDKPAVFSAFKRQTQVNPTWLEPWMDWASLQWSEGKKAKAINIIKTALTQNENSPILLNCLASYYHANGQIDLAIRQYEAILRHNPTDLMAANNLAYMLVDKKGDSQSLKMALSLTKNFETTTRNPFLLDTLAWIYYKMGLHKEATSVLKKALPKAPDHPLINYHFGLMTLKTGDRVTAKKHLEKAAQKPIDLEHVEDARQLLAEIQL